MPYRSSLHSMINMMADFGVFEGREVTIKVRNGTQIEWAVNPPLEGVIAREVQVRANASVGTKPS